MNLSFYSDETEFILSATSGDGLPALLSAWKATPPIFWPARNPRWSPGSATAGPWRTPSPRCAGPLARPVAEREDLLAEELRLAARGLGRLTGRVDVEDILDVIFRDFCIGK